jgi:hypothetical protein
MPAVNGVGEPRAGEPHARIDGRGLETERGTWSWSLGWDNRPGNRGRREGPRTYRQEKQPRQSPTLLAAVRSRPVLANVVLHPLDRTWAQRYRRLRTLIWYADDGTPRALKEVPM